MRMMPLPELDIDDFDNVDIVPQGGAARPSCEDKPMRPNKSSKTAATK